MDFTKYNINTMDEFFNFCNTEIEYGWIDDNGHRYYGINYGGTNCLQSPQMLMETKLGICWDVTELCREYFSVNNYKSETYFIYYDDGKDYPSHSILVFYKDNNVYWFEPRLTGFSGIYKYNSIEELLGELKNRVIQSFMNKKLIPKDYNKNQIYIYKFDKPKYRIKAKEYYDSCCSGQRIMI